MSAKDTAAANAVPPGEPALPPGETGAVGRELPAPEPGRSIPQCGPCPPGTVPTVPPKGAAPPEPASGMSTEPGAATLTRGPAPRGFVPGQSRELVDSRSATSTTFANPDGTRTMRLHNGPAYARNVSGRMVPVDTRLARGVDGRYRPAAALDASFAATAGDPSIAAVAFDEGIEAGFAVESAASVAGTAAGSEVRYVDVRPNADLVLSAIPTGVKESIVLKSVSAPTVWRFPLRLLGLTPELVDGGGIDLRDAAGTVRAAIPPGFMYDSVPDPRTGQGVRSNGVAFTLVRENDTWVLQVSVDVSWLRESTRRFPVVVDPSLRETNYGDTFVSSRGFANRDNGSEQFLKVGTYDGGGERAATYLKFIGIGLTDRYILGAKLFLYQTWARSCTPSTLFVHRVTSQWGENDVLNWPGPAYDAANPVAQKAFARGGNCTSRPAGWEEISIPDVDRVGRWFDGRETFWGLSLRASNTDNNAEKYFYSGEYPGGAPFLDVLYSNEGASYSLPNPRFSPPVTPSQWGFLDVDVTNLGVSAWPGVFDPEPAFDLIGYIRNSAGTLIHTTFFGPDYRVYHGVTRRMNVMAGPLPAGTYTVTITMRDPNGHDFDTYYGVPHAVVSFTVLPEATPEVVSYHPPNNARVDRLRPALWAQYYDADSAPAGPSYWFKVCNGTPAAPVGCQDSQWITSATWTVPAGVLSWGTTSFWYVAVYDGKNMSYLTGPYYLTPVVAQPEITHHLAGAPDGADVPGLNVQVGNYSTEVTDASVAVAGPPLSVRRTYNSQDPRGSGAFGVGWSTPLDQRVSVDPDGSGNVVVTLASGRQVRFGVNADGGFTPPPGYNLTLVRGTSSWTLRDASGERQSFDTAGNLTAVVDAYGREQHLLYNGGVVAQIRDVASGRSLYLTWSSGRVTTVRIDAPTAGAAQPVWTYTYNGNRLTRVCSPLSAQSCVDYQYTTSSHYRSIVIDDNPTAYWPLSESAGGNAANAVTRNPNEYAGTYSAVTLGRPGALVGATDTAVQFGGSATSGMTLPANMTNRSLSLSVEVWFKATTGQAGVLYSYQDTDLSRAPGLHSPAMYVGTDGKLRGYYWTPSGNQMMSAGRVDDGLWHHAVLVGVVDRQELYLDGLRIGQITTAPIAFLNMGYAFIGNGSTAGWAAGVNGNFPFTGQMDEVAFYRHPVAAVQVAAHYTARNATRRLTKVVEPGAFTALDVSYDGASGRVSTMRDRHGATWTVTQPSIGAGTRAVTLSSTGRDAVTYSFDANRGGRLVSRATGVGTEKWDYDANGFVTKYTDANNRDRYLTRDARGNVLWEIVFRAGAWDYKEFGYYLNTADRLDPRNDHLVYRSGTRNGWDRDPINRIRYELDGAGRITKITYPGPAGSPGVPVETFVYTTGTEPAWGGGTTPAGLLLRSRNKLGGLSTYDYDARGDLKRSVDPVGLTTEYGYDLLGRNLTRTMSGNVGGQAVVYGTWNVGYNAASLTTSESEPGITNGLSGVTHTRLTTYSHDASGRLTQKTLSDTTGGDPSRTWRYAYDPAGRPRNTTAPDGGVTTQEWNTAGDLAKETRPNGLVLEYRYDDLRHLIQTTAVGAGVDPMDPAATRLEVESRAYDPAGQLASVVDAMGRETAFTYHNDGLRETEKRIRRDANGDVTSTVLLGLNEYDHGGNLIRVSESGGIVRDFDYDDAGLRNRETLDPTGVARTSIFTFASDGQVASQKQTNGFTFVTGRSAETVHLFANNGSQIDGAGNRYADGAASFTYRFTLHSDATNGTVNLEVDNHYLVQVSSDNQNWTEVLRETRDIRDGSNRRQWLIPISSYLQTSKTVYVRVGDSQPANGWGGSVARVAVDYSRGTDQPVLTSRQYDVVGRPTHSTVANAGGTPATLDTRLTRDSRGLVTAVTDPAGAATGHTYDSSGRLVQTIGPPRTTWVGGVRTDNHSPMTTLGRNAYGDVTDERDPALWTVTRTEYDAMGRPARVTRPAYTPPGGAAISPTTTTAYNADGQPVTTTDPLGRVTSYAYDKHGRLVTLTLPDPDGAGAKPPPQWRYGYDRVGEPLEVTDPIGARHLATYNDLGHQITDTAAERVGADTIYYTTTLGRDDQGLLSSVTSPLNHVSTFRYNRAGDQIEATDPVGRVVENRYSGVGRLSTQILAGERATRYGYDGAGRPIRLSSHAVAGGVVSAPLRTYTTNYDPIGRPVQRTSAAGRIAQYSYDTGGNLTAITQRRDPATAITVGLGYDAAGRQTRTVDGMGNATDYEYNAWGLQVSTMEPATAAHPAAADRTWTTVYDSAGQPVRELAAGGITRTRTFDGLGRLTTESGTGGGAAPSTRTIDYDPVGRQSMVSSPAGDQTYTWNDRGLLAGSTGPVGVSTFTYDSEGNLTGRTDPSGTGGFSYDAAGRLSGIADALTPRVATLSYTPAGDLAGINYGAARPARTFTYDNLGRLTSDTVRKSDGATALSIAYTHDPDDLVTGRTTTGGVANQYGYDGLSRLTSWTRPDGQQVAFGYDAASNRTSVAAPEGTRTFSYDARNRLLSAGGFGPAVTNTWSGRGTLDVSTVDGVATAIQTDAFDRTVAVTRPGLAVTNSYDALDRLAQRSGATFAYPDLTNNAARVPTPDGDALIFRGPDGSPLSDRYGTDPGRLLVTDGIHADGIAALDNLTGVPLASRSYQPFGEVSATNGRLSTGFQGGWTDPETGLVNAHARWYDPTQASFTTRDSWTLNPDPVSQANRYAYANGNPTTYADPAGHCPVCVAPAGPALWQIGVAVAAAVGGFVLADQWARSGAAGDMIRSLLGLGNAGLTNLIQGLHEIGAAADEILRQVRDRFRDSAEVIRITGPATIAPRITVQQPHVAAPTIGPAGPPPPLSQTVVNTRPLEIALLPAGQQIQNAVDIPIELAIPTLVLTEADGSDAANAAAAGIAAAAAVAEMADSGDPSGCDNDQGGAAIDAATNTVGDGISTLDPGSILYSQSSVNDVAKIVASMVKSGWVGKPIDVVQLADGRLVSVDNTRVLAARMTGTPVQARIHAHDAPLSSDLGRRFRDPRGGAPETWGQAVLNRIGSQNSRYRTRYPCGSDIIGWSGD